MQIDEKALDQMAYAALRSLDMCVNATHMAAVKEALSRAYEAAAWPGTSLGAVGPPAGQFRPINEQALHDAEAARRGLTSLANTPAELVIVPPEEAPK